MAQISSMFYGLYIWELSNTYLGDSSLKAYMLILLRPFFSNAILPYRAHAGRGITESEWWDNFRLCRRAHRTQTLSLPSFIGRSSEWGLYSQLTGWARACSQCRHLFCSCFYRKASPLVACQVQALGNLEPGSVEAHVPSHSIAIDRKGWLVSLFSGQPGDCFPKGGNRCSSYVSTVPFFPPLGLFGGLPFSRIHLMAPGRHLMAPMRTRLCVVE